MRQIIKKGLIMAHSAILFAAGKAPGRSIPPEDVVVSPAHGKIIELKMLESPDILFDKKGITNRVLIPEIRFPATAVIIEMTPLDVHVQRAPIDGIIVRTDHHKGSHHNAMGHRAKELVRENEKTITIFENITESIGVIQVAGIAARRIKNVIEVGDELAKGDIYGRILFGSQVVVVIPSSRKIAVSLGQRVVDGESILAQ